MNHTYWNHNGKYQTLADRLEDLKPAIGYTHNRSMNLFILMSHLYYDAYNNGGGNVMDCFAADYDKHMPAELKGQIKLQTFAMPQYDKVEEAMDMVLEHLVDSDMHYTEYYLWCNNRSNQYCLSEQLGDEWFCVSFGSLVEKNKYMKDMERAMGYSRLILPGKASFNELPVICSRCGEYLYYSSDNNVSQACCPHCGYFHAEMYEHGKVVELYHNDGFGAANFAGSNGFEQTALPYPYSREKAIKFFSKCKDEYEGEIKEATMTWWDAENSEIVVLIEENDTQN